MTVLSPPEPEPSELPTAHPQASPLFKFRAAVDSDKPFLLNSWLRSYWESSPFTRGITRQTFFRDHHSLASATLANAVTLVAVPAEGEDLICGWVCADALAGGGLLVHYVYVKESFRRFGLARSLIGEFKVELEPPTFKMCSHMTPRVEARLVAENIEYSPYLLFASTQPKAKS